MLEGDTSFDHGDPDEALPAIASLNESALRSGMIRTTSGAALAGERSVERVGRASAPMELDNPTPQLVPPPSHAVTGTIGEKHVLVGLPARGKTHMAKRLERYLAFFHGARTKVFNVGEYRRREQGAQASGGANFFNPLDANAASARLSLAKAAVRDMVDFLFHGEHVPSGTGDPFSPRGGSAGGSTGDPSSPHSGRWSEASPAAAAEAAAAREAAPVMPMRAVDSGRVAIFDATNSTRKRRAWLREQLAGLPIKLLFVESMCTDEAIVDRNIWNSKVGLPDFASMPPEEAFRDFKARIAHYESVYEPMDEEELAWIKLINCGRRVEINNIHGYLLGRIVQFLANMHNTPHSIYLTRHGQSEYNRVGKIGGDSPLSPAGEAYARKLADYVVDHMCKDDNGEHIKARLWTSSLKRTIGTARYIQHPKLVHPDGSEWVQMAPRVMRNLDEIYAGVCDGMTYADIEQAYPEEFKLRKEDKLGYRYPRGESYLDVISRLDPLVHELESYSEPVLIVGHQAVLRLIYAYFTGKPREACPRLSIPLNTIIKLTPRTHDCEEERITMDIGVPLLDGGSDADSAPGGEPPSH